MNIRKIKNWLPPIAWNWLRFRFGGFRVTETWPDLPASGWQNAAQEAAKAYDDGVRRMLEGLAIGTLPNEDLVTLPDYLVDLHHRITQFALIAAKVANRNKELELLDFGGGFGTHALVLKRLLPNLRVNYTVCDLPEFCEIGKKLNHTIHFISDLDQVNTGYQLVYASSSVQYIKGWRNLVANLCKVSKGYIFITRTPFIFNQPSFITVQKAYGTEYHGWVFNFHEFIEEWSKYGMRLNEVFINDRGIPVVSGGENNIHLGLLFNKSSD
jgi:putative methyltransferase (TIGR04325 family)